MLLHQGAERSQSLDLRLGCSLALVAGALNSAGFYSLGFFASNMTGNVSTGADKLALGDLLSGAIYLLLPIAFIAGAALAAFVIELGLRRGISRIFALCILSEAVLLFGLGLIELFAHRGGIQLVLGLSILMGFQNAVVTRISNWRVRTTHVSGMSTDIGVGLGTLVAQRMDGHVEPANLTVINNLKLHGTTVLTFCVGGVLGVFAYKLLGGVLLLIAAIVLALVAGKSVRRVGGKR
ncbi:MULTISPECIES: YoaK family protein [unclassified Burkholderia]|uniref:YoaK family protein n=1 Tax=unclassified Burkholderia TaxID=2613784 RepID=UPI00141DFBD5|nr:MULTISPECIES: YoaK family protein [unclassified Burkholderia]NIE82381.1 DUF1275 domain-containing protein [Burkholderia sp. Tr-860]NIF61272.1 DUF1275 domain-containing protein [Burkholderia sp. Cy-647]NIF96189.1 DUF1275 domain-containing protein [Burkholderia sp. Ax-1720]